MDETKLVYISLKLEKLAQLNSSPSWKSKTGKIRIERQIREDLEAILSNTNIITFNVLNLTGLLSQFDVTTIELSTQMYPTIAYARVVLLAVKQATKKFVNKSMCQPINAKD
ncbi:17172_t:CDS:2 [Entrophospora sp. SA101]|nr:17172_t:CDS:2 [Entrophospora sp. SA101]